MYTWFVMLLLSAWRRAGQEQHPDGSGGLAEFFRTIIAASRDDR